MKQVCWPDEQMRITQLYEGLVCDRKISQMINCRHVYSRSQADNLPLRLPTAPADYNYWLDDFQAIRTSCFERHLRWEFARPSYRLCIRRRRIRTPWSPLLRPSFPAAPPRTSGGGGHGTAPCTWRLRDEKTRTLRRLPPSCSCCCCCATVWRPPESSQLRRPLALWPSTVR